MATGVEYTITTIPKGGVHLIDGVNAITLSLNYFLFATKSDITAVISYEKTQLSFNWTSVGTSFSWAPPMSIWNSFTTTAQMEIEFTVTPKTAIGTNYGDKATKKIIVCGGDALKATPPTSVTTSPINIPGVNFFDVWPAEGTDIFVEHHSGVRAKAAGFTAKYGATIVAYHYEFYSGSEHRTHRRLTTDESFTGYTPIANNWQVELNRGIGRVYVKAEDSRGIIGNGQSSYGGSDETMGRFTVEAYENPGIANFKAVRCDEDGTENRIGLYLKLSADFTFSSLGGYNAIDDAMIWMKDEDGGNRTSTQEFTPGVPMILGSGLAPTQNYVVYIQVTDRAGFSIGADQITVFSMIQRFRILAGGGFAFFNNSNQQIAQLDANGDLQTAGEIEQNCTF